VTSWPVYTPRHRISLRRLLQLRDYGGVLQYSTFSFLFVSCIPEGEMDLKTEILEHLFSTKIRPVITCLSSYAYSSDPLIDSEDIRGQLKSDQL
jgi:hypothetical protein